MIWKIPTHHSFSKRLVKYGNELVTLCFYLINSVRKMSGHYYKIWRKKKETDHPPKHLFSAQEIDPLTAKVRAKKPPSPGSEWIWFDRLWDPTVRIPSLISVLMENYLSMICIISLEKKSYKFHSNAIYKPSNLKYVYTV